jgi:hypothetical protein
MTDEQEVFSSGFIYTEYKIRFVWRMHSKAKFLPFQAIDSISWCSPIISLWFLLFSKYPRVISALILLSGKRTVTICIITERQKHKAVGEIDRVQQLHLAVESVLMQTLSYWDFLQDVHCWGIKKTHRYCTSHYQEEGVWCDKDHRNVSAAVLLCWCHIKKLWSLWKLNLNN